MIPATIAQKAIQDIFLSTISHSTLHILVPLVHLLQFTDRRLGRLTTYVQGDW